jgi:RND superfamily putative drug exporter
VTTRLSRPGLYPVKKRWDRRHDQHAAVSGGLSATGRATTCAALIIAGVFTAFVDSSQVVIKMLAIGLAASVLLDATVVRLLLVPAVMYLPGPRSWWLPGRLNRSCRPRTSSPPRR